MLYREQNRPPENKDVACLIFSETELFKCASDLRKRVAQPQKDKAQIMCTEADPGAKAERALKWDFKPWNGSRNQTLPLCAICDLCRPKPRLVEVSILACPCSNHHGLQMWIGTELTSPRLSMY